MRKTNIPPRRYLQKLDEFLAHWPLVNTALGSPLALQGNYLVANLTTDRGAVNTQLNAVVTAENSRQSAIADRDTRRASLRERFRQFNQAVRAFFPNSTYAAQLPRIPGLSHPMGVWAKAMQDVAEIWNAINAITPVPPGAPIPLTLVGGYTRANFLTDQTAMLAAFTSVESSALALENAQLTRDQIWLPIYERLKQYRLAVQARFAAGAALLESLPSITPAPGHTPAPVNVSASWDPNLSKAVIVFEASTDPDLIQYELRGCFGNRYRTDEEAVLGSLAAGASPLRFETNTGLVASGSRVFYKVYVILNSGNEKGSRTVSVTRP